MQDIMLDLEGMDSARTAAIVSIGATYFDIDTQTLGEPFYVEISQKGIEDQISNGRTWSMSTFVWWMGQSSEARNVFLRNEHEKVHIIDALNQFQQYVIKKPRIWGNGVDYDNVVLRDCYETFGKTAPWSYGNNRCYRTIKNMFGHRAKLHRTGSHHNGLDDAITQAQHLMAMMKGLKLCTQSGSLE